ncbi:MAG: ATP-binding protein [Actinobacteria bacterium]|nr:ATP-binding protein [Actinomycetota bacterium]
MGYHRRILDDELDDLTRALPAIALEGAKGVGKTATASQRARSVHRLDEPATRAIAQADLARLLVTPAPVLVDEWQYVPPVWDSVRRAVDAGAAPGSFLLTGSASPRDTGAHSGGGRIVSLRMRPLSLAERYPGTAAVSLATLLEGERPPLDGRTDCGLVDYVEEILHSGFPGIQDLRGRPLRAQLDGYLARIVDRDFADLGHPLRNPSALRRWMTAYAAATATTTSFEKIRDASTGGHDAKPARTTVQPYRDVLERLFMLDEVPGWKPSRNHIAELGLPPKHHLADPALAARLLGATADTLLEGQAPGPPVVRDGTLLGALFESLVTLSVRVYAQAAEARVGHLRTHRGAHEIDLVVERADGRVVAIEVKLAATPQDADVKQLEWLRGRLGDELLDAVVVTTGRESYRRPDGIAVVPAALLGP